MNHNFEATKHFLNHNTYKAAGAGVLALGIFVTGNVITNTFGSDPKYDSDSRANVILENKLKNDAILDSELAAALIFDQNARDAISNGPIEGESNILALHKKIGDASDAATAFLREARSAGYDTMTNLDNNNVTITFSAKEFSEANGDVYQPEDTFTVYSRDIDNDGVAELFAKSDK